MEKFPESPDDRLLDYLDGTLSHDELQQLKEQLVQTPALRQRLEELRQVQDVLSQSKLESPSLALTNKVIQNLHRIPAGPTLSPKNGMLLLAGMLVTAGILMVMMSAGSFDNVSGLVSLEQLKPVENYFHQSVPTISINGKLVIKILVGVNLIVAFFILDRTILRPLFQRRAGMQF
ncbi:MAG TPA: hypothetical protein PLR06_02605 [Cyclobacteriaceae bacterium]|nr:hypothetical protein [Cyclobacteriaceae bacterium]